jgi:hypothetical protein
MGLSLQVGVARHVFMRDAARDLARALEEKVSYRQPFTLRPLAWSHRDEMASSWVGELQSFAETYGAFPQLGACDAWSTVYLPVPREPAKIEYGWSDGRVHVEGPAALAQAMEKALESLNKPAGPMSIICASLLLLEGELRRLAGAAGLPLDARGCEELVAQDRAPAQQAFGHFVLATRVALRRGHPLWVVK